KIAKSVWHILLRNVPDTFIISVELNPSEIPTWRRDNISKADAFVLDAHRNRVDQWEDISCDAFELIWKRRRRDESQIYPNILIGSNFLGNLFWCAHQLGTQSPGAHRIFACRNFKV